MKEPLELGAQGAGGFEDGEHEVDFEVNFRADLEWIDGRCGIDFGSIWNQCGVILEANWGPFGHHFGVNLGSMSRFGRDSSFRPRRDQISGPLDRFWGVSWAPCWAHVGPMLAVVGRLGPSWQVLGAILSQS